MAYEVRDPAPNRSTEIAEMIEISSVIIRYGPGHLELVQEMEVWATDVQPEVYWLI